MEQTKLVHVLLTLKKVRKMLILRKYIKKYKEFVKRRM